MAVITLRLFYLGFRQLHRARLIEDTPTSRIRSAAQGYAELEGRAVALGDPLYAPLSGVVTNLIRSILLRAIAMCLDLTDIPKDGSK